MDFEVIKEQLPSPWASYLVNGVADSLYEGEEKEIAETLEHLDLKGAECIDVLDDAHFHKPWRLNLNLYTKGKKKSWLLAGDYSTFVFHKEIK